MNNPKLSGAVHPTLFLVLWFAVGFGLARFVPVDLPEASGVAIVGVGFLALGGLLFAWSALELRRHGATLDHGKPTTALVTKGPFSFSRHPIYLALVLILFGLALRSGSLWFVLLTAVFWIAVQFLTVRREEAYLARAFPDEYARYRHSVRQWL